MPPGIPDRAKNGNELWSAVALLLIGDFGTSEDAMAAITDRAWHLGVPPEDVAAYVMWRGKLPI